MVQVEKGQGHLEVNYPCMAAVNRAASVIERHDGRLIWLTYKPEGKQQRWKNLGVQQIITPRRNVSRAYLAPSRSGKKRPKPDPDYSLEKKSEFTKKVAIFSYIV